MRTPPRAACAGSRPRLAHCGRVVARRSRPDCRAPSRLQREAKKFPLVRRDARGLIFARSKWFWDAVITAPVRICAMRFSTLEPTDQEVLRAAAAIRSRMRKSHRGGRPPRSWACPWCNATCIGRKALEAHQCRCWTRKVKILERAETTGDSFTRSKRSWEDVTRPISGPCNVVLRPFRMLSLEQHVQPATIIGFKQIELFDHTTTGM
jgi:hypothetical protein